MRHGVLLIALADCGSMESASPDLTAPAADDMSAAIDQGTSDLGGPADLFSPTVDPATFCRGTTLAGIDPDGGATADGECARQFFAQFAACYRPAGSCEGYSHNGGTEVRWDDGAAAHFSGLDGWGLMFWMHGRSCMAATTGSWDYPPHAPIYFCSSTSDHECKLAAWSDGGIQTRYFQGVFTCPDGTQVTIDLHGCPALNALIDSPPPCQPGAACDVSKNPPLY